MNRAAPVLSAHAVVERTLRQLFAGMDECLGVVVMGDASQRILNALHDSGHFVLTDADPVHLITFEQDRPGFLLSHPLRCRAADEVGSCDVSRAARDNADQWPNAGTYECAAGENGELLLHGRREDPETDQG